MADARADSEPSRRSRRGRRCRQSALPAFVLSLRRRQRLVLRLGDLYAREVGSETRAGDWTRSGARGRRRRRAVRAVKLKGRASEQRCRWEVGRLVSKGTEKTGHDLRATHEALEVVQESRVGRRGDGEDHC
jgi:hypothetical protein